MRRNNLLAQKIKMLGLAKKVCLVGGQQINRNLRFGENFPAGEQLEIIAITTQLIMPQALRQTPHNQGLLVFRQVNSGCVIDPSLELLEFGGTDLDSVGIRCWMC